MHTVLPVRLTFNPLAITPTTKRPYAHTQQSARYIMESTVSRRIYKDSNHTEFVGSVLHGGQIFNYGG